MLSEGGSIVLKLTFSYFMTQVSPLPCGFPRGEYCKPSFIRDVLISRFIYQLLICGVSNSREACFYARSMRKGM